MKQNIAEQNSKHNEIKLLKNMLLNRNCKNCLIISYIAQGSNDWEVCSLWRNK